MKRALFALFAFTTTAFAQDDVKILSGEDLSIQTRKWVGKTIQTKAMCLYADKDEFRCMVSDATRIDFMKFEPDSAQKEIEDRCDTLAKAASPKCVFTIRFVYEDFGSVDSGGILGKTRIVIAKDNKGFIQKR